jgi:hypothetical protein
MCKGISATDIGGAAVFGWLGNSPACLKLIRSLHSLSDEAVPHAIIRFAFWTIKNIYFAPNWWDALDQETRSAVQRRAGKGLNDANIDLGILKDDGVRAVSWQITARENNIGLD